MIYTCSAETWDDGKGSHFDTHHLKTIIWDKNDLTKAANELTATIRATLPGEAKLTD